MKFLEIKDKKRFLEDLKKIEEVDITSPSKISMSTSEYIIFVENKKFGFLHFDLWIGQVLHSKKENKDYFVFGEYGEIDSGIIEKIGWNNFLGVMEVLKRYVI